MIFSRLVLENPGLQQAGGSGTGGRRQPYMGTEAGLGHRCLQ